ncbi:unnamed protein product, partial [Nesidiocoris tenuis]
MESCSSSSTKSRFTSTCGQSAYRSLATNFKLAPYVRSLAGAKKKTATNEDQVPTTLAYYQAVTCNKDISKATPKGFSYDPSAATMTSSLLKLIVALLAIVSFIKRGDGQEFRVGRNEIVSETDSSLLNQLLDEGDELTLERTVHLCQRHEARRVELQDFRAEQETQLDAIKRRGFANKERRPRRERELSGRQMIIADALSRAYLTETAPTEEELDLMVHSLTRLSMSEEKHKALAEATKHDALLSQLITFIQSDWPNKIPGELRKFQAIKDQLSYHDDLLFFEDRVVVPQKFRKIILSRLHEGHLGVAKTRSAARRLFYWPGMSSEIEKFVASCREAADWSLHGQWEASNLVEQLIRRRGNFVCFSSRRCPQLRDSWSARLVGAEDPTRVQSETEVRPERCSGTNSPPTTPFLRLGPSCRKDRTPETLHQPHKFEPVLDLLEEKKFHLVERPHHKCNKG